MSISLYVLIAYLKWRDYCIEAGVKFLVIASLSTAFLLFGMGLIYAETGTMSFHEIFSAAGKINLLSPLMLAGSGLILAGIGFKLALVPFHMWTPDIYQGAPVPVTTFIATISKGAVLALALRLFIDIRGFDYQDSCNNYFRHLYSFNVYRKSSCTETTKPEKASGIFIDCSYGLSADNPYCRNHSGH